MSLYQTPSRCNECSKRHERANDLATLGIIIGLGAVYVGACEKDAHAKSTLFTFGGITILSQVGAWIVNKASTYYAHHSAPYHTR